ncbi:GMC family oxidoreductase N-terminal domain-containing protein [Nocardia cyriacigeorgica]|uniref:GMC family oxidoreductase N-terminal domain-containing protein n=1 Tax=Nocardia cyriacigeorgica TaxID=135487 RepID=UPI001894ADD5|nr:GMC family oxidoreductase N-terminal domain-containing protein [Nocardia cyriacigeorgica]MBF6428605.1 GMC family oxidoreductase N-terminal domain-containing protein [Nocardia cyriacigeorgica]
MEPTARQRAALGLICDTFAPGDGQELPSATDLGAIDTVLRMLERNPREAETKQLFTLLNLWDTRLFGVLTGSGPRRFSALTPDEREQALLRLGDSRFAVKRTLFQALKSAALLSYNVTPGPTGENPLWKQMGYPAPPGPRATATGPALEPLRLTEPTTLDCDVVIVGSGAGGGTAAAVLADAGLDVVVLERGDYYDDRDFGTGEMDGLLRLYAPGPQATTEGQLTLAAGSCLGGGTVVNWSTSLPTPDDVRAEWADLGVPQFTATEFDDALTVVQQRLGVNRDHSPLSARDAVLERGATALGWDVDTLPRNVSDACDAGVDCGSCGYGCRLGAKQSVTKTWLQDAAGHGARLVVDANVRRIEVKNGRAEGVTAETGTGVRIDVRTRAVVVAAGAIQTPALLRRSGLRDDTIGRYLRLHPAAAVYGVFDEEIRPWEGGLQARICRHDQNLDGNGYGVIYETGPVQPGLAVGFMNWRGAAAHRATMLDLARTGVVGVITRDRDHGRVTVDRSGEPVVSYRLSDYDRAHLRTGIGGAAQILEAAGARRIFSGHQAGVAYEPGTRGSHAEFVAAGDAAGYGPGQCSMAALHIMGSARMGGSRELSATDPDGATWEVPNIVVADASCFPTSSGVNPMVTIEAIAYMNAKRLAARLA